MRDDSDDNSLLIVESEQGADTFVQNSLGQAIIVRLLSFRCQEAQAQELPCQDYARITVNRKGSSICFCICDGVGSSYKGDFAAQYLALCMVEWLQKLTVIPRKTSKLLKTLRPQLDRWADEAQTVLKCFDIPPELPTLVREVLEELRSTYGSETVFLSGRIDSVEPSLPLSESHRVKVLFCWMGNVTARLFLTTGRCIDIGDAGNDYNRWSTARGRHGILRTQIFTFDTVERLIVHTDGLDTIGEELSDLSDADLEMQARQLLTLPTNDDMTVLDLQWIRINAEKEEQS